MPWLSVNHTRLSRLTAVPIPAFALDVQRAGRPGHPGANVSARPAGRGTAPMCVVSGVTGVITDRSGLERHGGAGTLRHRPLLDPEDRGHRWMEHADVWEVTLRPHGQSP